MLMIEDKFEIIELIDTYSSLLTDTQIEIIHDYYLQDITLGEIAENRNISRQAVHDSIVKSVDKLRIIESNLNVVKKKKLLKNLLNELHTNNTIDKVCYNKFLKILEE